MRQKCLTAILSVLLAALLVSCAPRVQTIPSAEGSAPVEVQTQVNAPDNADEEPPAATPVSVTPTLPPVELARPHGQIAMEHILFMNDNLYGRTPFSYRELEAARWIEQELLAMGHAREHIEIQSFSWQDVYEWAWDSWEAVRDIRQFYRDFPVREGRLSQNVILTIPGRSEQVIIVGAHYDGFPYPGAADNASGVALLLESAQRMLYLDNYHTIVYVFFGAEETGILGAYFYVESLSDEQLDRIAFVVNADVLFEGPYLIYATGYDRGEEQPGVNAISRGIDSIAGELSGLDDIEFVAFPEGIFWYSDHSPFLEEGHTVVVFAGLTEAGREMLFDPQLMHGPYDCIHHITATWPGMAERAMRAYSIFLERILLVG